MMYLIQLRSDVCVEEQPVMVLDSRQSGVLSCFSRTAAGVLSDPRETSGCAERVGKTYDEHLGEETSREMEMSYRGFLVGLVQPQLLRGWTQSASAICPRDLGLTVQ